MTLHEIIQKNMETFDEKFPINTRKYTTELAQDWADLMNDLKKDFKSHLLSSQLSIIQAIDEWAEKAKKEHPKGDPRQYNDAENTVATWAGGNNNALSDLRSFLEEAKTKEIIN
jgi:hypothetical protein